MAQSNKDIQGYRGGRGGYNNYNNYNRGNSYGYGSNNNNYTYRRNRNEPPRGGRSYYDSDREREFQKWDYEQSAGSRAHRSDTRWEESRRDQREEEINRAQNTEMTEMREMREMTEERGGGSMAMAMKNEGTAQGPWVIWGPLQATIWPGPPP